MQGGAGRLKRGEPFQQEGSGAGRTPAQLGTAAPAAREERNTEKTGARVRGASRRADEKLGHLPCVEGRSRTEEIPAGPEQWLESRAGSPGGGRPLADSGGEAEPSRRQGRQRKAGMRSPLGGRPARASLRVCGRARGCRGGERGRGRRRLSRGPAGRWLWWSRGGAEGASGRGCRGISSGPAERPP